MFNTEKLQIRSRRGIGTLDKKMSPSKTSECSFKSFICETFYMITFVKEIMKEL